MPFQNQLIMPDIYRMGDILILTSLSETWGLSVNEAMACSRAILVTDTCGCAVDLVEPGVNGFIFKNNDGDDLLDKMKKFMLNQSQIAAMGRQSLQKIQPWKFENVCIAIEQSI